MMKKIFSIIVLVAAFTAITALPASAGGTDSTTRFGTIQGPTGNCANSFPGPTVGFYGLQVTSVNASFNEVKFGLVVRLNRHTSYDVWFAALYFTPQGNGCTASQVGSFTTRGGGLGWFSGTSTQWVGNTTYQLIICQHGVSCLGAYGGTWASPPINV